MGGYLYTAASGFTVRFQFIVLISGLLYGCQAGIQGDGANLRSTEGYSAEATNKLFVVDCLLPGQIRKLGSQMTYLTARRPIKTTAGDCEIRGGEYVAYDRANYASALRVWLPQAKQGDAEAQAMVGEIYEKGLGGVTDFAMAAQWYRKSAEQGNSRGQINLGYLYEKGLGVEKNLPQALNWYRKASGLDNTDLQFASVTEAQVASGYEEKMRELEASSQNFQKQAEQLRKQLSRSEQKLAVQQSKLNSIRTTLENTRNQLEQEKSKANSNPQRIKQLEQDLRDKQSFYNSEKAALVEIATQVQEDKKINSPESQSRLKLTALKQQLQIKETQYQDIFVRIKSAMNLIEEKSSQAFSTQDKLAVQQMRKRLNADKSELAAVGNHVRQLKESVAEQEQIVASFEKVDQDKINLVQAGIEIIEPPMVLTRGIPSFQLRSISANKKIIGKVAAFNELQSLTVNGQPTEVDKAGVFQTLVPIANDLTPVEIVANYKKGSPGIISFNLLAKADAVGEGDQFPPSNAKVRNYPNIEFGRFYALVIGNRDYAQLPSLKTSVDDAKAVDEVLRTHYGYKTTLLINASRHQVMTALNDLRKILTEQDNLLIYYAGHGEIDKSDQSAYWLPTDAEKDNTANWISSHSISQYLNIISAKHILVVADSCYSGAMTETAVSRLPESMAEDKRKKWLKFMVKRRARTVLTSGGEEPVLDSGGGRHSVFANAFLNVLRSNSGLLEDYELFRSVSSRVQNSAALVGFQQSPQYSAMLHAGHEGSPFFFVPKVQ